MILTFFSFAGCEKKSRIPIPPTPGPVDTDDDNNQNQDNTGGNGNQNQDDTGGGGSSNTEDEESTKLELIKRPTAPRKYTIKLLSDPKDEDPWHPEFSKEDPKFQAELQHFIAGLEEKYDVRFVVQPYSGNYIDDIEKQVAVSGTTSSIARISTTEGLIQLVSKGALQNLDSIVGLDDSGNIKFQPGYEEYAQYLDTPFQVKVGQLSQEHEGTKYTKHYGISRYSITSMFNMMLYNATMLDKIGVDPVRLWKKGEWTWGKFREIKFQLKNLIDNTPEYKAANLPTSEGGKPFGFSFQFYMFDLIPQRTGKTIDVANMKEGWVRNQIDDFVRMWKNGENQTAMWEEMSHNNAGATKLEDIKYWGSWSEKWRADGWSPNQHGGSKCFEINKTAFAIAEPWMYQDAILGKGNNAKSRGWRAKLIPVPTDVGIKPEMNNADNPLMADKYSKITGVSGDILAITKGQNSDIATKVLLEWNKFWVDKRLNDEGRSIKINYPEEYGNMTDQELREIVKSGELKAKLWVKDHLLSNENITEEEYEDQVAIYKYYSDPKRLTENAIDKRGLLIPFMDALHLYMVDGKDLNVELDNALNKIKDISNALLTELKK